MRLNYVHNTRPILHHDHIVRIQDHVVIVFTKYTLQTQALQKTEEHCSAPNKLSLIIDYTVTDKYQRKMQ